LSYRLKFTKQLACLFSPPDHILADKISSSEMIASQQA
jgi:hypothetical protein